MAFQTTMCSRFSVACFFFIFSGVLCIYPPDTVVFTGTIIKQFDNEEKLALVNVRKILSNHTELRSLLTVKNVEVIGNQTGGLFLFYVVPRHGDFDALHYWTVNDEDFKDFQSGKLRGLRSNF